MGRFALTVVAALLVLAPSPAKAAEVTTLASSFDADDPFDFNLRVGYSRQLRRGAILRQLTGESADQPAVRNAKDLRFSESTHTLSLRAEVGLWHDLQFHVELPIVLSSSRSLSFAQNGGDPCGSPATTNCVTPLNSTTVRDGFLSDLDLARDQVTIANDVGGAGVRLLPGRSGIDQVYLGLSWAALSQARDDTKPTWVIGIESRIAAGAHMEYDPDAPEANTAVGRGVHQLHFWTTLSRRFPFIDSWIGFHYLLPLPKSGGLHDQTHFAGSGQERAHPQHRGYVDTGLEVIAWERPKKRHHVTIELAGRLEGVFEGRGYSPIWELLANQDNLAGPCLAGTPSWDNGRNCASSSDLIPYPGITRIENHLAFFGTLAVNVAFTKFFRGRLGASLGHEQDHFITAADAGQGCNPGTSPGCAGGQININEPGQVNPMYRPLIDAPGRRYRVAESTIFDFFVSAVAEF